jgi:hypothetical protein
VETSAPREYEFTTARIVSLVIGVALWVLLGVGAMARDEDADSSYRIGFLLGSLLMSLVFAWIVRSLARLILRRPVMQPAWTPSLFWIAVVFQLLSAAGNADTTS